MTTRADAAPARAAVVPPWAPRLTEWFAVGWGLAYAAWATWKFAYAVTPRMCEPPPIANLAAPAAVLEATLGVAAMRRSSRAPAALVAFALNVGLVGFAVIAQARGLPWENCGCFFGGLDAPWLPWHAALGTTIALPFFAVFLDAERRARG